MSRNLENLLAQKILQRKMEREKEKQQFVDNLVEANLEASTPLDVFYTMREFSKLIKVSYPTINKWIKMGKINAIKIGAHYRIYHSEVDRLFQAADAFSGKKN